MAKDKRARSDNRITIMALANMLAALVDTMRDAGFDTSVIHAFLDRIDHLNAVSLSGAAGALFTDFVEVVRSAVPAND